MPRWKTISSLEMWLCACLWGFLEKICKLSLAVATSPRDSWVEFCGECSGRALCDQISLLVHFSLAGNFVFILHVELQVLPAGSSVPSSDLCHWPWCSSDLILFLFFLDLQHNHCLAKQNAGIHWGSCCCSNSWELDKEGAGLRSNIAGDSTK